VGMMNIIFERLSLEPYKQSKNPFKKIAFYWRFKKLHIKLRKYAKDVLTNNDISLYNILMEFGQLLSNLYKIGVDIEGIKIKQLLDFQFSGINDSIYVFKIYIGDIKDEGVVRYEYELGVEKDQKNWIEVQYHVNEEYLKDETYHFVITDDFKDLNRQNRSQIKSIKRNIDDRTRVIVYSYLNQIIDRM
jgi:hypothetical protein